MERNPFTWLILVVLLVAIAGLLAACAAPLVPLDRDGIASLPCPVNGWEASVVTPVGPLGVFYKRCELNSRQASALVAAAASRGPSRPAARGIFEVIR